MASDATRLAGVDRVVHAGSRAVRVKPLYATFGCSVEVLSPTAGESDGVPLLTVDTASVRSLFATYGLVLFRGFTGSLDAFRAFSDRLCDEFRARSNTAQRIPVTDDATIVTANQGLGEVLLHGEMYYLPEDQRPDVLWLYCSEPPAMGAGGETTFADGTLLLQNLSPATKECFENRRIVYPRNRKRVSANGETARNTVSSAIGGTRHGRRAFVNSILNRYQHVGERGAHPSMVHFEDGTPIPDEMLRELLATARRFEERLEWRTGDVVMLDNSWILHGRRAFSGPRHVVTRMANLRKNQT